VAARQGAPVLGVLCERPTKGQPPRKQRWEVTLGYRFLPSYRHFIGTVEQVERERLGTQIRNTYHLFDVNASYQINPRWSLNASIPFVKAYRNQLYVPRGEFSTFSQGDATFGAQAWLWKPPTESSRNIGLGVALKVPSGRYNQTFNATDRNGRPIVATADQSVQPGDGGTGVAVTLNAYSPAWFKTWAYFQGLYLFNPRNTNGVSTFRTRPGETVMSVSDQYLYRAGLTRTVPGLKSFAVSFGGRIEGVPVRDAFGRSEGFRRPGYAISLDPGFLWAPRRGYMLSVNIPWAIERNRKKSVSDYQNRFHGDAAFADYSVIIGLSKRF
jgi:hypothetical protein